VSGRWGLRQSQRQVDAYFDASKNTTKITSTGGNSTVTGLDLVRVATSGGTIVVET